MRLNSVHAIIIFDEMQNGAIWGHFRVSYNIESSTILMTIRYNTILNKKTVVYNIYKMRERERERELHFSARRADLFIDISYKGAKSFYFRLALYVCSVDRCLSFCLILFLLFIVFVSFFDLRILITSLVSSDNLFGIPC
jgi:hypothetical protein